MVDFEKFQEFVLNLKSIIVTIIVLLIFPIIATIIIPIHLFRWVVKRILAPIFRPDLAKILPTRSSLSAVDNFKKPRIAIGVRFNLATTIPIESFQQVVKKAFDIDNFIETTQYIESYWGFFFWKSEEKFDIKEHVYTYEEEIESEEAFFEFMENFVYSPFESFRSPWQWIKVRKQNWSKGDILVLRVHHSLADGYSILNMITKVIKGGGSIPVPDYSKYKDKSLCIRLLKILAFFILGPFELIKDSLSSDDIWVMKENQLAQRAIGARTSPIPISLIKEIKNIHGVSFMSVVIAAYAGALRNYITKEGLKVPRSLKFLTPFPADNHPDKLRNLMKAAPIQLPTGYLNPIDRLKKTEEELNKLKKSVFPHFVFILMPAIGGLFTWMIKPLFKPKALGIMSNFPGLPLAIKICETNVDLVYFVGGFGFGVLRVGFTSLSYNNEMIFSCGMDKAIGPTREKMKDLIKMVEEEIYLFKEETHTLIV